MFRRLMHALLFFVFRRAAVPMDRPVRAAAWHRAHRQQPHLFSAERLKGNASGENLQSFYLQHRSLSFTLIMSRFKRWPSKKSNHLGNMGEYIDLEIINRSFE